jgi:hypothetical protein
MKCLYFPEALGLHEHRLLILGFSIKILSSLFQKWNKDVLSLENVLLLFFNNEKYSFYHGNRSNYEEVRRSTKKYEEVPRSPRSPEVRFSPLAYSFCKKLQESPNVRIGAVKLYCKMNASIFQDITF